MQSSKIPLAPGGVFQWLDVRQRAERNAWRPDPSCDHQVRECILYLCTETYAGAH